MIDYAATLDPRNGLVASSSLTPPRPPEHPLWQGLAELSPQRTGLTGPPPIVLAAHIVGAYGTTRADALPRAAGEAVERYALLPCKTEGYVARAEDLTEAICFTQAGAELADPAAQARPLRWYPAHRMTDQAPAYVPAGLVDYPARSEDAVGFDPSPSGAASGPTLEHALLSAVLELIERDALITAWTRQLPLPLVDTQKLAEITTSSLARQQCRRMLRAARSANVSPLLAHIPTGLPDTTCMVGIIVDTAIRPLAAVGASAAGDPAVSGAKALLEALQIRTALRLVRERHRRPHTNAPRTDLERAQYFASPIGVAAVTDWIAHFTAPVQVPTAARHSPDLHTLVRALHRQGVTLYVVSLTHRLPPALRAMGWHAVKAVPVGLQALRMDETHNYNWNHTRIACTPQRTGLTPLRHTRLHVPHPLI
ncbi:YcaO-like family protein [Streptomyces chrestomyceticus]|uniref:YcaO-like family protein n=1 Tax=Streptomyces chrestomyceticus TaxID=68185 RepID=UPI0035A87AD7